MNGAILPDNVRTISQHDFWSQLQFVKDRPGTAALLRARQLGLDGKKEEAYRALAEYHREALASEYELWLKEANEAPVPDPQVISDLLRNRFPGWGSAMMDHGERIDWSGKNHPHVDVHGFHYLGWLEPGVRHALRTGDRTMLEYLARTLTDYWQRVVVKGEAGDPAELTFGSLCAHGHVLAAARTYLCLVDHGLLTTETAEALLCLVLAHGRAQCAVTRRFIVHNIHTAGVYGLFYVARLFPEFEESKKWDKQCIAHLITTMERSFFEDGGHLERCWGYGRWTLERLTRLYFFSRRTGGLGDREDHFVRQLRNAYRWYAKTLGPKDQAPGFGDDGSMDGGPVIDLALKVFPDGTPRDLGVDRSKSYLMRSSGYAIMRNGGAPDSLYVTFTFGDFCGYHAHFDLLSMNVWGKGAKLLNELERFGPYAHPLDHVFRAPESHNQVLIDHYLYDNRPCVGQEVDWYSDEVFDYASACHRAYREVPQQEHRPYLMSANAVVRRTIVFVRNPGYLLVLDSVCPEGGDRFNRAISQWWHAPLPFAATAEAAARTGGDCGCLLAWAHPAAIREFVPGKDYDRSVADAPGDCHSLRVRSWLPLTHTGCLGFATLLYPFAGAPPTVALRVVPRDDAIMFRAETFEVQTPAGTDVITLNPESIRGQPVKRARLELGNGRGEGKI